MLGPIIYGNYGGVYLKRFSLDDNNILHFDCTDLKFNVTYNNHLKSITLKEFATCVKYFGECVPSSSNNNLANLEYNLIHKDVFDSDNVESLYEDTSIIHVSKCDDYRLGVSLEKGDNTRHDFMVVYKMFQNELPELKTGGDHDEMIVYKSYKDGKIKVIYFTREEVLNIISNCRLNLFSSSK